MLSCWFNKTGILTIFYYYVVNILYIVVAFTYNFTWRNIGRSGKAIKIGDDLCLNLNTSFLLYSHLFIYIWLEYIDCFCL